MMSPSTVSQKCLTAIVLGVYNCHFSMSVRVISEIHPAIQALTRTAEVHMH